MKNINKSKENPDGFLDKIIKSKQASNKERLISLKNEIKKQFRIFEERASSNTLHGVKSKWKYDKSDSTTDGYFLYHQYENSKSSIVNLRAEIIENNNGEVYIECPICGFRETTDLDHYMPRQLFPEFSIHPYNLIPTCHECNNDKSIKWCESTGQKKRLIFNAYYDTPTNEPLFDVRLTITNKIPNIILTLKAFDEPVKEETRIALSTIKELNLLPIFNIEINKRLKKEVVRLCVEYSKWKFPADDFFDFKKEIFSEQKENFQDINNLDHILLGLMSNEILLKDLLHCR